MVIVPISNAFTPQFHLYSAHQHHFFEKCRVLSLGGNTRHASSFCNFESEKHTTILQRQQSSSHEFIIGSNFSQNKGLADESDADKLIKELTSKGCHHDAVELYLNMLDNGLVTNEFHLFPVLVKAIGGLCDVKLSRQIHGHLLKLGVVKDVYVANSLLSAFWKCGASDDARRMFKTIQERDSVSWSTMITGFHQSRLYVRSLEWFTRMVCEFETYPNRVACISALSSCASVKSLIHGRAIHGFVTKRGLDVDEFVLNGLLEMYMKCRCTRRAGQLFENIVENARKNTVLWNVMISGYVDNGCFLEALLFFTKMMVSGVEPDPSTMVAVLILCSESLNLAFGKQIHALIIKIGLETDVRVGTSLIDMYFKCDNPDCGLILFDRFHNRNVVMWGTVITNCARSCYSIKALDLYVAGFKYGFLDSVILLAALRACSSLILKPEGMVIHGMAIKLGLDFDTYIGSALIDMYAKCQDVVSAHKAFLRMPVKDEVSWSNLLSGYAQNELWDDALETFREMHQHQIRPNAVIIACLLSICARVFVSLQCNEIHGYLIRQGFETNILVNNSLIAAYAKCGNIESSQRVFSEMEERDKVSWNSILLGLGIHGHADKLLVLFDKMKETGLKPDHQTFTAILSACSHTGRVAEGLKYFRIMKEEHMLEPKLEQYTCLVDLLGRAGCLDQAYDLIMTMPHPPDDRIWGSLLSSCKIQGDERMAELIANHVFELNADDIGYRVLLANLYEDFNKWNDVRKLRSEFKVMGLKKSPGCSWIDVNHHIHVFTASDKSHHQVEDIYAILESLTIEIKRNGYIPQL